MHLRHMLPHFQLSSLDFRNTRDPDENCHVPSSHHSKDFHKRLPQMFAAFSNLEISGSGSSAIWPIYRIAPPPNTEPFAGLTVMGGHIRLQFHGCDLRRMMLHPTVDDRNPA